MTLRTDIPTILTNLTPLFALSRKGVAEVVITGVTYYKLEGKAPVGSDPRAVGESSSTWVIVSGRKSLASSPAIWVELTPASWLAVRAPRLSPLRTTSFGTDCYAAEGIEGRR